MEPISLWFRKKTVKLRHGAVKLVAPKLWKEWEEQSLSLWIKRIPRPSTQFMRFYFGQRPLIGAEIGVASGDNAFSLLSLLPIKKLYLIDPYEPYLQFGVLVDSSKYRNIARKKLEPFQDKVVWIYEKSEDAKDKIMEPLDFVYIDGNHQYEYVKKDIQIYSKIVRDGGIISGHDIYLGDVYKAVFELYNDKVLIFFPDWIVIKGNS